MEGNTPYLFKNGAWVKAEGIEAISLVFWKFHHENRYAPKTIYTFANPMVREETFPNTFDHYDMEHDGDLIVFPRGGAMGHNVIPCGIGYQPYTPSFLDYKVLIEDKIIGEKKGNIAFSAYRRSGKRYTAVYLALRLVLSGVDVNIVVRNPQMVDRYVSVLEYLASFAKKDNNDLCSLDPYHSCAIASFTNQRRIAISTEPLSHQILILTDMNFLPERCFDPLETRVIIEPSKTIGFFTPHTKAKLPFQLAQTVNIALDVPEELKDQISETIVN